MVTDCCYTGSNATSFWIEVLKLALPSLMVIIGWYIVSQQQNRRERRKEIRELISIIKSNVDSMVDNSVKYPSEEKENEAQTLAGRIKYESIIISKTLLLLSTAGLDLHCEQEMADFRNAAMGDFFETTDRKKRLEDPNFAQDLALYAGALLDKIETAYFTFFKMSMDTWRRSVDKKTRRTRTRLKGAADSLGGRGYRRR